MKTRQEIKTISKQQFLNTYWISVGGTVLALLTISAASVATMFLMGLGTLFLAPSILVGLNYFSLCIYRGENPTIETLFTSGFNNYGRKLGGMLWMYLFVYLWTLLFVIPGIIKALAYSMTPYILGDHPDVAAKEALKISMRMTEGYKGQIFMMLLSFFGWMILSGLTFGLVGIFYSYPYMFISMAGLYEEIKNKALDISAVHASELA